MSNLTIFNFENTPVQTIVENNEIFFRAAQLAELLEYKKHDLQEIAWDWFTLVKCVEFTNYLIPALDSIQSKFTAQAHSIVSEYGSMLRRHQPLIQKLTADFKVEMWGDENWNRDSG